MPFTTLFKLPLKIKLIFGAVLVSALFCIVRGQIYTGETLVESLMLSASLVYLFARYYISSVIARYQNPDYRPSKVIRVKDDLTVNITAKILLPLAMNFVIACACLLAIKYFNLFIIPGLGRLLNAIISFNEHYLKYPIIIMSVILGVLTICRILTEDFYKKYRKLTLKITSPVKILAIIVLFLGADQIIQSERILFEIHAEAQSGFDTSPGDPSPKQIEKAKVVAKQFVNAVIDEAYNAKAESQQETSSLEINPVYFQTVADDTYDLLKTHPEYRKRLGTSQDYQYSPDEHEQISEIFPESGEPADVKPVASFKNNRVYEKIKKKPISFFDAMIVNLSNEDEAIEEANESFVKTFMKDIFGDIIGNYVAGGLKDADLPSPANSAIFKDATVDIVTDQLKDAVGYLFDGKPRSKAELAAIIKSVAMSIKPRMNQVGSLIGRRVAVLQKFSNDIQDQLVNGSSKNYDAAHPTTDITYEDGLKIKQDMERADLNAESMDNAKVHYKNYIESQNSELDDDEKQKLLDKLMADYKQDVNKNISHTQEVVSTRKYSDFAFVRDEWTSGGIFFGLPIDDQPAGQIKLSAYFPLINPKDTNNYAGRPSALWIVKKAGNIKIFIKTAYGVLQMSGHTDSALLVTAYQFVDGRKTYPSIIDIFYKYGSGKTKPVEVPAYHYTFVHNEELKNLFKTADSFIFDMLDKKINSPLLIRDLTQARVSYKNSSEIQDGVSDCYSRLYDVSHLITSRDNINFTVHTNIMFSVVQTLPKDRRYDSAHIYNELTAISDPINMHKQEIIASYPYLQKVHEFAGYQALFRSVSKANTNIIELYK